MYIYIYIYMYIYIYYIYIVSKALRGRFTESRLIRPFILFHF